jgi:ribosomal protein S18 acetylase RimI-like enzyme
LSYAVEILADCHDRGFFDCGVEPLNRYLRQQASQDIRRYVATICVAVTKGGAVAGYYSLAAAGVLQTILPEELQKKMPRYNMLPAVLLGRLAVDLKHRGRGLGVRLLTDAFALSLSSPLAWTLFLTDAKDDLARSFYEHFGFKRLKDSPLHLYITRQAILKAMP